MRPQQRSWSLRGRGLRLAAARERSSVVARWAALAASLPLWSGCDDDARVLDPDQNVQQSSGGGANPPGPADPSQTDWSAAPRVRGELALDDEELARSALALMAGDGEGTNGRCGDCHSLGRPTLTLWAKQSREFAADCLSRPSFASQAELDESHDCVFDREGSEPSSARLGIYAAATHLGWFEFLFEHASARRDDDGTGRERFVESVGMPRAGELLSQEEFDLMAEWFARELPLLYELVPADSGEECSPALAPRLTSVLDELSQTGWRELNRETPLLMYGCAPGAEGLDCFDERTSEGSLQAGVESATPGSRIAVLHDNSDAPTSFWTRSSADGRYVASGLREPDGEGYSGQILDLSRNAVVSGDFSYDATFFPDNRGFLAQQTHYSEDSGGDGPTDGKAAIDDVALICPQSVLDGRFDVITGEEDECRLLGGRIGLYQQLAESVNGSDYWVVHGSYVSDDGGFEPVLENPRAAFASDSRTTLTPMLNLGNGFEAGEATRVATPNQGDPTLSPSGRLLVTRVKGPERVVEDDGFNLVTADQSGYALHLVTTSLDEGGVSASLEELGRLCLSGGKATFSYDERWLVLHRYVTADDAVDLGFSGPGDEGFQDYAQLGASNLYLVDLLSGEARRITRAEPGRYALFPHFRSDGWIYFVVRGVDGSEHFAASDAALLLE